MNETISQPTMSLQDIMIWIIQHQDDTNAMDSINRATYTYTTKFKERQTQGHFPSTQTETANHDASRR